MTARAVHITQIECDSCGAIRDGYDLDATVARISASRAGWKYAVWDVKGLQKRRRTGDHAAGSPDRRKGSFEIDAVPRQWDCCPECPLPESPMEAAQIRNSRKVRNSRGKWVDKESA